MTQQDRRRFLKLLGLTGAASMLPPGFLGCADDAEAMEALADTGPRLPDRLPRNLTVWNHDEIDVALKLVSGKLPSDLAGHAFIVGALPYPDGSFIFNGDGIVFRVDLDPSAWTATRGASSTSASSASPPSSASATSSTRPSSRWATACS
jgi:hypothetical protein